MENKCKCYRFKSAKEAECAVCRRDAALKKFLSDASKPLDKIVSDWEPVLDSYRHTCEILSGGIFRGLKRKPLPCDKK